VYSINFGKEKQLNLKNYFYDEKLNSCYPICGGTLRSGKIDFYDFRVKTPNKKFFTVFLC